MVYALHAHLVFVTKYRRGALSARALGTIRNACGSVCLDFGATLKAFNGEDDHVYLLVDYPPTVQLSKLVNSLKGVSSRRLRKENFPEVRQRLWSGHLWSPSYFVASCGEAPLDVIRAYIEKQRESPLSRS